MSEHNSALYHYIGFFTLHSCATLTIPIMYCVCYFYLHTNSKYLGLVITVSFNKVITALSHTYGYDSLYKTSRQFSFFVTKLYIVLVYNSIISMLFFILANVFLGVGTSHGCAGIFTG